MVKDKKNPEKKKTNQLPNMLLQKNKSSNKNGANMEIEN